jgi:hypothetical protein
MDRWGSNTRIRRTDAHYHNDGFLYFDFDQVERVDPLVHLPEPPQPPFHNSPSPPPADQIDPQIAAATGARQRYSESSNKQEEGHNTRRERKDDANEPTIEPQKPQQEQEGAATATGDAAAAPDNQEYNAAEVKQENQPLQREENRTISSNITILTFGMIGKKLKTKKKKLILKRMVVMK